MSNAKWYVIHTYSGYENKVKDTLLTIVENRNLQDLILDVKIPLETVTEIDANGNQKQVERKVFPGYCLVKMVVTDDTWFLVRNIRGVTGFVGASSTAPVPLSDAEVAKLGVESGEVKVGYKVGDTVEIVDGEYRLITTDMYGGKSGSGILINMDGEVVGIIEQEYASDDHHSITAIPISPLKSLIEKLSNNSALSYIGIHGLDISEKAAEAQDIPSGVYVSSVEEDSPALQAGLQPGDIITSVGLGSSVTLRSLHENIMNRSPGDNVEVTVMRQGSSKYAEFDFVITIGELPEVTESESATSEEREAEDASKSDESGETESSAA